MVDSGASVHMVGKKDLNKAEVVTVRISKNPMMVVTAKGEVQTKEEATVYVSELESVFSLREFVVDSVASIDMLSRKDLNSAELETVKVSQNPTTVVTGNGGNWDLFVTLMLLEDTPAVLSIGKLCEYHGVVTVGPVVRNQISSKMAGRPIATQRTMYPSLFLVYRQALQPHLHLLLLHPHRRKP